MSTDRDTTRIVRSWLRTDENDSADRILGTVLDRLDTTPQRRATWWPARRLPEMNSVAKFGVAAAAVVVAALLGFNYLIAPNVGGPGLGDASPTPTPSPTVAPTPSPTLGWPEGTLEAGRHAVQHDSGVAFSFEVPEGWRSTAGYIESGTFPSDGYRWILYLQGFNAVAADRCSTQTTAVGPSVQDLADAMTTIPGTVAADPVAATVGGLPAQMVELTLEPDVPCPLDEFWLFGVGSAYPNSPESTIRVWVLELNGRRYSIFTDQVGSDPAIGQEIIDIVESIEFD
jgi:hypothetical protein